MSENLTENVLKLEDDFSAVKYNEDYMLDEFISQGGASSDREVLEFLGKNLINVSGMSFNVGGFGCSTLNVNGNEKLFGRNFDWQNCNALILSTNSKNDYASISTVNTDFIKSVYSGYGNLSEKSRIAAAVYAPLDGMNEKGLCVAVNMISDGKSINQQTAKPDITTTTAVRLMLDKAANVEEAVEILEKYDMHSSMGLMIHFAISDIDGNSVVVEYINNEMIVTETNAVTNFYLSEGSQYGIGSSQSHERYDILVNALKNNANMNLNDLVSAMDSVSKDNFNEFESTEWTVIYDKANKKAHYYHRENYDKCYTFNIN